MRLSIVIILASLAFSCGNAKTGDKTTPQQGIEQKENSKTSGSLKTLDDIVFQIPDVKKPVVLFFDAQAEGTQFLNRYGEIFRELNIGIVASNKYRNGISSDEAGQILQQMMQAAQTQGADMQKIYLMGFSGGGKFAQNLAEILPNVKSVITMGIGRAHMHRGRVPEVNIIGVNDMNFRQAVMYPLSGNYSKPDMVLLHGKGHEWAPKELVSYTFTYCLSGFNSEDIQLPAQADTYVNKLNIALNRFDRGNERVAQERLNELLMDELQKEQQWLSKFQSMFQSTHFGAWSDLFEQLNKEEKNEHIKSRVTGFLSMINYVMTEKYIEQGLTEKVNEQLKIYKLIDPENNDILLLTALNLSKQGNNDEAMSYISKAIEQGFANYQKLYYMKYPEELSKREDFVLTLNQIYQEREIAN